MQAQRLRGPQPDLLAGGCSHRASLLRAQLVAGAVLPRRWVQDRHEGKMLSVGALDDDAAH